MLFFLLELPQNLILGSLYPYLVLYFYLCLFVLVFLRISFTLLELLPILERVSDQGFLQPDPSVQVNFLGSAVKCLAFCRSICFSALH